MLMLSRIEMFGQVPDTEFNMIQKELFIIRWEADIYLPGSKVWVLSPRVWVVFFSMCTNTLLDTAAQREQQAMHQGRINMLVGGGTRKIKKTQRGRWRRRRRGGLGSKTSANSGQGRLFC